MQIRIRGTKTVLNAGTNAQGHYHLGSQDQHVEKLCIPCVSYMQPSLAARIWRKFTAAIMASRIMACAAYTRVCVV
jgi:hypothetical protein